MEPTDNGSEDDFEEEEGESLPKKKAKPTPKKTVEKSSASKVKASQPDTGPSQAPAPAAKKFEYVEWSAVKIELTIIL